MPQFNKYAALVSGSALDLASQKIDKIVRDLAKEIATDELRSVGQFLTTTVNCVISETILTRFLDEDRLTKNELG